MAQRPMRRYNEHIFVISEINYALGRISVHDSPGMRRCLSRLLCQKTRILNDRKLPNEMEHYEGGKVKYTETQRMSLCVSFPIFC